MKDFIEIPFGAEDSELKGWEYTIPEGYTAEIKDGKVIVKAKEPELTEFEKCLLEFANKRDEYEYDSERVCELNKKVIELTHSYSAVLLELAKKELCSKCRENIEGYIKGQEDAEKDFQQGYHQGYMDGYKKAAEDYNKSVAFHYDDCARFIPCYAPGGVCTNPHFDCVNCPKKTTGGSFSPNTNSGTSTLKAEGKEYYGG